MSFANLQELIEMVERENTTIAELMIKTEEVQKGLSRKKIIEKMSEQFTVMEEAVRRGTQSLEKSHSGLTGGVGSLLFEYANKGNTFLNAATLQVAANVLAVSEANAAIVRIAATPTARATGVLSAVLVQALDSRRFTRDQIVRSIFTASALDSVIANKDSKSKTVGGCQVDIMSATATLVELAGGTPKQVGNAVGISLENSMGLVREPVAGLVDTPCIYRNGLHAITAQAAADMALAGVVSIIPPDEVMQVMHEVGQQMPESLKEQDAGSLAGTLSGQKSREKILGESSFSGPANYQRAFENSGLVMVGPSSSQSSHIAGAVRIGNIAYQLLKEKPLFVKFTLMGSFAETYQGQGTDLALLAGVLGLSRMGDAILNAKEIAEKNGLKYEFTKRVLGSYHPNTVLVELAGESNKVKVIASSLGGGKVEVQEIDGYPLKFSGERPTILIRHSDRKGAIADMSWIIQEKGFNIARMGNERSKINGPAITICEVDDPVDVSLLAMLKREIPIIDEIVLVQNV